MKKILLSLAVIAIVGAVAVSATGAFFSDTETSTGNTFTAGAIDLKIDSVQHYNGMVCVSVPQNGYKWAPAQYVTLDSKNQLVLESYNPDVWNDANPNSYPIAGTVCTGTWPLQDLGNGDVNFSQFFNFSDLKPGDFGENTISLHVENNPAWACANITITSDEDVTCTEPEIGAEGQGNCVPDTQNAFNGEIGKNLSLAWWADDGDNILESDETNTLFFESGAKLSHMLAAGGTNNKVLKLTLADSFQNFFKNTHPNGGPLNGSQTYYVGLAWCFGDMGINGTTITCDGAPVDNKSQTDSLTADMTFTVTQARNQETFRCEDTYKPQIHRLVLENEDMSTSPWTPITGDNIQGVLTWEGDGETFDYDLTAQGLPGNTSYSLIYYADPYPGNHPGKLIGTWTTENDGSLNVSANPDLNMDLPTSPDTNIADHHGAKIWLIPTANYNGGQVTPWTPDTTTWLFEGNVYINYHDTNISN